MVKPSGQRQDDTETRILNAADAVFIRRGTDGARMQEIADEAGVNKALLHYYYRTKEQLSRAVFVRAATSFLPALLEILASDASLDEKIDRVVGSYLEQLSRRPYLAGYVLGELAHHADLAAATFSEVVGTAPRRAVRKLHEQIEAGVRAGELAPIAAEQFIVTLLGSCVFPFAAQPMIVAVLGLGPRGFDRFIEQRRKELPALLKRALRP